MENTKFCQSCAMPLTKEEDFGTNANGTKNEDYCVYCYTDGAYTSECTMDEMIEFCVPHMSSNNEGMSEEEARKQLKGFFPTLKRWNHPR